MYFYRQKCSRGPRRGKLWKKRKEGEITLKRERERGEVFLRARIRIAKREKRESRLIIKRNVLILLLYY